MSPAQLEALKIDNERPIAKAPHVFRSGGQEMLDAAVLLGDFHWIFIRQPVAAKMMRRVLVNQAVGDRRQKRGGSAVLVSPQPLAAGQARGPLP